MLSLWHGDIKIGARRGYAAGASMRSMVAEVAERRGIPLAHILGRHRTKEALQARQEAMWTIYDTGYYSTPQVGRLFDNRDHSTVIYNIRAHARRVAETWQ